MATLEDIRGRINSAEKLQSVVRTMRTIAAVSIRQYERAAESLDDYVRTLQLGLNVLLKNAPQKITSRQLDDYHRLGCIVFGSDQGMCGQFNEEIVSHSLQAMQGMGTAAESRLILAVGERVKASLENQGEKPKKTLSVPSSVEGITATVQQVLFDILEWNERLGIENIVVFHNRPLSGSSYEPDEVRLLPVDEKWLAGIRELKWPSNVLPTFTMDWDRLFSELVHQFLFVSVYRACALSLAAENASRLASMQSAENNIEETLEELLAKFRHERQKEITEELLDIVSGFEALTGKR